MFQHRLWCVAAAVLCFGAGEAAFAQPAPAPPAAQAFKVGDLQLIAVRDANFVLPNDGKTFGLNATPQDVAKVLAAAGAPTDSLSLSVDALVVKAPGHVVLLDTGLGPRLRGVLQASLAAGGISPSDVTDILITHSHGDHVGGLLDADGKSAFPKAAIRMSANEWASLQGQPSTQAKALVAAIAAQVKPFEPGQPILPGITPIALYGHTPGHVGYVITSGGQTLEDIGDTAHSSIISLAKPDWTVAFDGDRAAGAAMRRQELTRLAAGHTLVFAPHFPFPGVGRIEAAGDGFRWKPEALKP
jgi:glyoxylase-like metal-dependent hydrolase (beta-lactamase superfamily II)